MTGDQVLRQAEARTRIPRSDRERTAYAVAARAREYDEVAHSLDDAIYRYELGVVDSHEGGRQRARTEHRVARELRDWLQYAADLELWLLRGGRLGTGPVRADGHASLANGQPVRPLYRDRAGHCLPCPARCVRILAELGLPDPNGGDGATSDGRPGDP